MPLGAKFLGATFAVRFSHRGAKFVGVFCRKRVFTQEKLSGELAGCLLECEFAHSLYSDLPVCLPFCSRPEGDSYFLYIQLVLLGGRFLTHLMKTTRASC